MDVSGFDSLAPGAPPRSGGLVAPDLLEAHTGELGGSHCLHHDISDIEVSLLPSQEVAMIAKLLPVERGPDDVHDAPATRVAGELAAFLVECVAYVQRIEEPQRLVLTGKRQKLRIVADHFNKNVLCPRVEGETLREDAW